MCWELCLSFCGISGGQSEPSGRNCDFSNWNDRCWINSRLGWRSCRSFPPGSQTIQGSRSTPSDKGRTACCVDTSTLTGLQLSQNTAKQRQVLYKCPPQQMCQAQGSTEGSTDSSKLRAFSLQRITKAYCACAILLTQSCYGKVSKNVPVWRWGLASLTCTQHWNHSEISTETSDSSQFFGQEFINRVFKSSSSRSDFDKLASYFNS